MNNQIVIGSLSAIAAKNNISLAESFMSADLILVLDCSGSMYAQDAPGNKTRWQVATEHLERLQKENQGKIALICFADYTIFSPAGFPVDCGGSTNLSSALNYILPADDTGIKILIVSDGSPNSPEECLKIAKQFKTSISTLYCGPETDHERGRKFLEELARCTGGKSVKSDAPGELFTQAETYLLNG